MGKRDSVMLVPVQPMTTPLLTTKLFSPPLRLGLVARPHLVERLNAGLPGKMLLISAPAGFGKTTLIVEWLSQVSINDYQVAWLSLDDGDNELNQFLIYLIAALRTNEAGIGKTAEALLQTPQPAPVESVLTTVINDIAASGDNHVLVLDDYHLITTQPIHAAVVFLLDHIPGNLRLVIATRSDPALPLARLRGQGLLTELRAADLRFNRIEADQFLKQSVGLDLSTDKLSTLNTRTEGWIAGLQMAAISIQSLGQKDDTEETVRDFIADFAGSNRFILDYLVEEVLHSQPEHLQKFLIQTAIVDRLNGSLCDALTGQDDGQVTLEMFERANLFIVPLDDKRVWYRYHHLFSDLLRNQLQKKQPNLALTLHRRASEWFEQHGLIPEAMQHAVETQDFGRAAALMESLASPLLNESRPATFQRLMAKLPNDTITDHPWLAVHGAWACFITWQFDRIEPLLQAVERWLEEFPKGRVTEPYSDENKIRGRMIALRAFMAQGQGDLKTATSLSLEALEHLDEADLQLRSILEMNLGDICVLSGDIVAARQHLESSINAGKAVGNYFAALGSLSRLAELEVIQGCLHQAVKTYQRAIQLGLEWGGGKPMPGTGLAHVGLAGVLYEWNDLVGTADQLSQGIRLCELCGEQYGVLAGTLLMARLRQAQGMAEAAATALEEAESITVHDSGNRYADQVSCWQARISLVQGDLLAAGRWAESQESALNLPDIDVSRVSEASLTLVRIWIAQERSEAAESLLAQLLALAETEGRMGREIEIRVLMALADQARGKISLAMTSLERALDLAEPEGYVRIFVDEGLPMAQLLYEAARREIALEYGGRLLAAFPPPESGPASAQRSVGIVEPLSERELEVLQGIAEGLSNQEISQRLFVSLATIKWHTSNIYSKLGVKNRTQAVAQARSLGIIPSS